MKKILIPAMVVLAGLIIIECDTVTEPTGEIQEEISAIIQAEDSLFSMDGLNDATGDSLSLFGGPGQRHPGFGGPIFPRFVRRTIESTHRSIDVEILTGDSAIVTVTHQIVGKIFIGIDSDTTDSVRVDTVWEKPFDFTSTHKAQMVNRPYPEDTRMRMGSRHNGWRVAGMTPIVTTTAGSDLLVEYLRIRNVTSGESETIEDPLNDFLTLRTAPLFDVGDSVVVEISVENGDNSGTTILSQFRMPRMAGKQVNRLLDDGIAPDETADDGVFTDGWKFDRRHGMQHVTVDVLDNDLLTVEETPYNAVFWRVPFMVLRRGHGGMGGGM
ncbi:MAG: hypothetical protein K9N46_04095 [Candidatus Marinimicrobia bacterium]|nr:hypothetical protein [Candidatus Neomarinimicrobiota bacterium]MCF7828944.1 hypothetical protein [Candidatus Neomarinimicrobiota bacterium]MCF7879904.1 hypothetical protein [Candidatus Neomarinimicrobiota bacterium]